MVRDFRPFGWRHAIFGAQHAAPALAQDMELRPLAQVINKVVQFIDEKLRRPEIRALVGQQGGISAAQLVVVDDGTALQAQQLVGIEIVMGRAGAAMQDKHGRLF